MVGLICITVLMITGAIESNQGIPIITMIIGYAIGNGIAAKSGDYQPLIGKKKDEDGI